VFFTRKTPAFTNICKKIPGRWKILAEKAEFGYNGRKRQRRSGI
jgi:hypothetical protein